MEKPENLIEAVKIVREYLSENQKDLIMHSSEEDFIRIFFEEAAAIRDGLGINDWDSPLSTWFREKGVDMRIDMSNIILRSVHRRVRGEKIRLNEQIRALKAGNQSL